MMGAIMVAVGAAFVFGSPAGLKDGGFWVGIGLILGAGGCLAGAFGEKSKVPLRAMHPGPLVMGIVMTGVGGFLFIINC